MEVDKGIRWFIKIYSFAFSLSSLSFQVFLLVNIRICADITVFPVNNFSGINVFLSAKDLRDLVFKNLRHEWLLMWAWCARWTIKVSVSINKITQCHGLTARVRYKLELVLNKVKDCFKLALSSFIKDIRGGCMSHCFSSFSKWYNIQASAQIVVIEVLERLISSFAQILENAVFIYYLWKALRGF